MFGPHVGPRRRNGIALAVASVTASLAFSSLVQAEDAAPEAVIGTFESAKAARASEGRPATFDFERGQPAPARDSESAGDDEISRIFADALDALENGNAAAAQRKFEVVVARDPESHLAKDARGYLADLYRSPAPTKTKAEKTTAESASKFTAQRSGLGAADVMPESTAPAPVAAVAGIPVSPGVEEEFIVEAGDRVFFGSGSAELGQRARIVLAAQARWLARRGDVIAVVEGHADDGSMPEVQSAKLSELRAIAVRDRLVAEGVPAARLTIAGAGRSQPIANCPGSDCAAQNRRVVTVLKLLTREGGRRDRGKSVAADATPQPTH
jgi:outer membrane protein OmpA-like peptidoglycan-associated protein